MPRYRQDAKTLGRSFTSATTSSFIYGSLYRFYDPFSSVLSDVWLALEMNLNALFCSLVSTGRSGARIQDAFHSIYQHIPTPIPFQCNSVKQSTGLDVPRIQGAVLTYLESSHSAVG